MKRLIDADALISKCGYFIPVPGPIVPGIDTLFGCPETAKDIIEKQPMMICETIEDGKIHEVGVFDIIDECDFQDHIKEDLAKEIGCAMMKRGMITFVEHKSSDGMFFRITATANVVTQMPKKGEQYK